MHSIINQNSVIEINNISKSYYLGGLRNYRTDVLKNITLKIHRGEIFSLLGPNGAGKTTLMKIILGITFPTKGSINLFNKQIKRNNYGNYIGYLPEQHQYPENMKAHDILKLFGMMRGMRGRYLKNRVNELISVFELRDYKKPLSKYSKGMKQRLGLAVALLYSPDILLLDEPTDGLDPVGRVYIRELILDLKKKGTTIFINSHLLSEVEAIADRVAILDKGHMVTSGTVDDLTSRNGYEIVINKPDNKAQDGFLQYYKIDKQENMWKIYAYSSKEMNTVLNILKEHNVQVEEVRKMKSDLESYFISVINGIDAE